MDRPNSTTKTNNGIQDSIAPGAVVPISPAPHPCWKTATITPYAAPTDSRLSPIVVAAIMIELNATSIRMNVMPMTNRKTGTMPCCSWLLKSLFPREVAADERLAAGDLPDGGGHDRVVQRAQRVLGDGVGSGAGQRNLDLGQVRGRVDGHLDRLADRAAVPAGQGGDALPGGR